jgi:hypothetical protein
MNFVKLVHDLRCRESKIRMPAGVYRIEMNALALKSI